MFKSKSRFIGELEVDGNRRIESASNFHQNFMTKETGQIKWSKGCEEEEQLTPLLAGKASDFSSSTSASSSDVDTERYSWTAINDTQALMHIIKASVGTGLLAIPSAFQHAGLTLGAITLILASLVVNHTVHLLIAANRRLANQCSPSRDLTYAETVELAVTTTPSSLKCLFWIKHLVRGSMILGQIGTITSFHIFLAENIKTMVDYYELPESPPLIIYQLAVCLPLLGMVSIRSLRKMAFLSGLSNLLAFAGILLVTIYCCLDLQPVSSLPQVKPITSYAITFGMVIFAFESVNVILPIESRMKRRKALTKPNGVLNFGFTVVFVLFFATGFYGYLRFGESVPGAIIYAIPMSPWYFMLSKPFYTLSILANYCLQSHVLFQLVWEAVPSSSGRLSPRLHRLVDVLGLRVGCVVLTLALAALVPRVDIVISLQGAFTGSFIALVFPAGVDALFVWTRLQQRSSGSGWLRARFFKDLIIIAVGILGAVAGTYASISAIFTP